MRILATALGAAMVVTLAGCVAGGPPANTAGVLAPPVAQQETPMGGYLYYRDQVMKVKKIKDLTPFVSRENLAKIPPEQEAFVLDFLSTFVQESTQFEVISVMPKADFATIKAKACVFSEVNEITAEMAWEDERWKLLKENYKSGDFGAC